MCYYLDNCPLLQAYELLTSPLKPSTDVDTEYGLKVNFVTLKVPYKITPTIIPQIKISQCQLLEYCCVMSDSMCMSVCRSYKWWQDRCALGTRTEESQCSFLILTVAVAAS